MNKENIDEIIEKLESKLQDIFTESCRRDRLGYVIRTIVGLKRNRS